MPRNGESYTVEQTRAEYPTIDQVGRASLDTRRLGAYGSRSGSVHFAFGLQGLPGLQFFIGISHWQCGRLIVCPISA